MLINFFHLITIIVKIINSKKNIKNLFNIDFKDINTNEMSKYKKTLFVCSHDYCFVDIISALIVSMKTDLINNTYTVVRNSYNYVIPGMKVIERSKDTLNQIIKTLQNENNVLIFYSRRHLQYLNIDKIVKEVDINIIPVKITSNTIKPISHNEDGVLENINIYLYNHFEVKVLKKIHYNQNYTKEKYIEIFSNILYPDGGYFNENDIFVDNTKN